MDNVQYRQAPSLISTLNKYMKHSIGVGDVLTTYIGYAKDVVLYKYPIETYTVTGKDKYMNQRYYIVIENDNKTAKLLTKL